MSEDTISRQAVIEINRSYHGQMPNEVNHRIWKEINELPSAQPEQCDDAVSRHRLLNDLEELTTAWEKYPAMAEQIKGVEAAIGYVKSIPSVQPETHEKRTETHSCDCISRNAAIDAMEDVDWYHINSNGQLIHGANSKEDEPLYKAEDVYKVLEQLPSAQPEKRTDKCTETHACDLISRQWLMECVNEGWIKFDTEKDENRFIHLVRDIAPSAQPQRTGRWINHVEDGYVECPFCHSATNCDDNISELHFCFSCGARMEESEE